VDILLTLPVMYLPLQFVLGQNLDLFSQYGNLKTYLPLSVWYSQAYSLEYPHLFTPLFILASRAIQDSFSLLYSLIIPFLIAATFLFRKYNFNQKIIVATSMTMTMLIIAMIQLILHDVNLMSSLFEFFPLQALRSPSNWFPLLSLTTLMLLSISLDKIWQLK